MFPRENKTERFYDIDDHAGPEEPAIAEGLRWLARYAKQHAGGRGTLVVHNLDSTEYVGRTLGAAAARELRRHRVLREAGLTIALSTERDLSAVQRDVPALFLWAYDELLLKLDDRQPLALCAVASATDRIDSWLRTWAPRPLRPNTVTGPTPAAVGPTVAAALVALSGAVNLGTGLVAPEDRSAAIDMVRKLIDAGESVAPDGLRSWAAAHGWTARGAQQLESIAMDLRDGKQLRARDFAWRDDAVEQWRAQATRRQTP